MTCVFFFFIWKDTYVVVPHYWEPRVCSGSSLLEWRTGRGANHRHPREGGTTELRISKPKERFPITFVRHCREWRVCCRSSLWGATCCHCSLWVWLNLGSLNQKEIFPITFIPHCRESRVLAFFAIGSEVCCRSSLWGITCVLSFLAKGDDDSCIIRLLLIRYRP